MLTQRSVFDYSVFTVARVFCPENGCVAGFVVFSSPVPYAVFGFRTIEAVAAHLSKGRLCAWEIEGSAYCEEEWEAAVI